MTIGPARTSAGLRAHGEAEIEQPADCAVTGMCGHYMRAGSATKALTSGHRGALAARGKEKLDLTHGIVQNSDTEPGQASDLGRHWRRQAGGGLQLTKP